MLNQTPLERMARQIPFFKGVNAEDVAKILAKGMTMSLDKGKTLFFENTAGHTMYIILAGSMGLYKAGKPIALLKTGDMLGEMALISDEPRSATAVAIEDSSLFVLSQTTFMKLLTKHVAVQILLNIVATLSHRLRAADKTMAALRANGGG